MATLVQIRTLVHEQWVAWRQLERIVDRPEFFRFWNDASEEEQAKIWELIQKGDRIGLSAMMRKCTTKEMYEVPLVELRQIARRLHVKYYTKMNYGELTEAIMKERNRAKS